MPAWPLLIGRQRKARADTSSNVITEALAPVWRAWLMRSPLHGGMLCGPSGVPGVVTMIRPLALLLLLWSPLAALAASCEQSFQRKVLQTRAAGRTVLFTFPSAPGPAAADRRESEHLDWVRANTPWNARQILVNHDDILRDALTRTPPGSASRPSLEKSIRNDERILSGAIGRFRAPSCMDQVAFREFLQLVDLRKSPQEFLAYVHSQGMAKVMIADFDDKPDGVIGVSPSPRLLAEQARLQAEGWTYHAHLHNHPFMFNSSTGDMGPIAPSAPDIGSYKAGNPDVAWITNGVEVFEVKRAEYQQLE